MNTMTWTSIHINVSKIQLLKFMLIYLIFIKFHIHLILISITTRGVNKPKLVIPIIPNTLISLWAFAVFKVFYASASIEESKIIDAFLTLVST